MKDIGDSRSETLRVDVEQVLFSKNPSLAKKLPRFVINYLKRIVHQEEINRFLEINGHLKDAEFIKAGLDYFGIKYNVYGSENIPGDGRHIFVSNHPLGGLDGLVFIYEISKYFKEIKFPVNDILMNIRNLSGIFVPINKHGAQGREAARMIEEAYSSDCQILYFPAGLCSRKRRGVIKDLKWHKNFITKAVQHKRDIVPAYFSGRNSNFFYNLSNIRNLLGIKANIEMLYLADEMFRQKEKTINLVFGRKIPWQTFDRSKSPDEWADFVKSEVYTLESLIHQAVPIQKNV
ncbi:MAG: 1-acyl-sn-glycerol-3-phosphate acyltransferase [Bacteroidales bacterium]|nr:1-acyl-sn-glycerol-3-phosphate acyltransferase [Bacteroidales bacterium]